MARCFLFEIHTNILEDSGFLIPVGMLQVLQVLFFAKQSNEKKDVNQTPVGRSFSRFSYKILLLCLT